MDALAQSQAVCPDCGKPNNGLCNSCAYERLAYEVKSLSFGQFMKRLDRVFHSCHKNFYPEGEEIVLEYTNASPIQLRVAYRLLDALGCWYLKPGGGIVVRIRAQGLGYGGARLELN